MCIVLATTAHPSYALIILDNRDEFILRPTSRPHWWTTPTTSQEILSARDLQREEQGTWLGITKTGNFAVLTNYRETDTSDAALHPVQGTRSRGGMVTAWLTAGEEETTQEFVQRMMAGDGVKGVGGFSLLCGKLRLRRRKEVERERERERDLEPLAIISNRCETLGHVPWIAGRRGEVYGLSNTSFDDLDVWPKVEIGRKKVLQAVQEAVGEEDLVNRLFEVLDTNTLPKQEGKEFEAYLYELRKSIFIPSIGSVAPVKDPPNLNPNVTTGIYGTQRQTIVIVDWEGKVTFRERSLWDVMGNPIERGKGDMKFEFNIEGWNNEMSRESVSPT
ncbi:hypothetical protein ONS96_010517 [Cadophora gregata f. sp. sojae]|nr:hypothetical protein ONS96_010517 [Cadophora gregata f. sp. sojae]